MVEYPARGIDPNMSFLEMLDVVNEGLVAKGEEPIAFEYDCREGICGACGLMINGHAHGPGRGITTCQLYMRSFKNGDHIYIEPWRAASFPVVKDLVVDRSAFDRVIQAGGYISINTGNAPEANGLPVGKDVQETTMDAAACIGCGACVAACPNASAMLFVGAKVSHLAQLPQGEPERLRRVRNMVQQMDAEGFGSCSNHYECEAACPKEISIQFISLMYRDYLKACTSGTR
jgi:succinate dehydrogenase / fumarate reductase iron-sulfur subunit